MCPMRIFKRVRGRGERVLAMQGFESGEGWNAAFRRRRRECRAFGAVPKCDALGGVRLGEVMAIGG